MGTQVPILLTLLVAAACRAASENQSSPAEIVWEKVGAWSGSGSRMLESFPSDSGMLRISWKANAIEPEAPGAFRLIVHSAISGRTLLVAVDKKGEGSGTAFVADEPRMYFMSVESHGVEWSFTVEERVN